MRVNCVGAIISDGSGRLLLIRRGRPPGKGLWTVPGGRVEPGESDADAVAREVLEETGLTVTAGRLAGAVERPGPAGVLYVIRDYLAGVSGGTLAAGDDAADARWFTVDELVRLPLSPGLLDALVEWAVIEPRSGSSATA
ncbi:ADP-ribose pyrophosphatase YjhB (NUDIX family) [Streptosporangium album]|uniref:ADP-ribose pyrophosphatase YjhB (NUDIX family) n=1 Tax=Streptosporangium album TaxID=47479 RepID=A0A7W7RSL3_9ACTN|nr:NUDIX domain-containing protein [Streptosporangium album]MBB4937427.1 ADP-ribose pyrophosphatase YjhB (NUDIX family) [Streptosporangium album]